MLAEDFDISSSSDCILFLLSLYSKFKSDIVFAIVATSIFDNLSFISIYFLALLEASSRGIILFDISLIISFTLFKF